MKSKILKIISISILSLTFLCGCGSSASYDTASATVNSFDYSAGTNSKSLFKGSDSYDMAAAESVDYDYYEEEMADVESPAMQESETEQYAQNESRKLIKTVNLNIQTKNFDTLTGRVESLVDENGGYIEQADIDGNGYYGYSRRNANYTIRVPKDKISNIINSLGDLGVISSKSERIEDVTLSYYDQDSQKKALEVEQDRLMEILADAENMEQIIALESRLSEVRYQINSLGTNLKLLDNKVDYSTIYLNVQEVEVEVVPETKEKTMFQEIAENWEQNIVDIKYAAKNIFINMTSNIGTIIFEIIVVIVIIRLFITKKKNKQKREEIKKKEDLANR